jgi:hypothetical protein
LPRNFLTPAAKHPIFNVPLLYSWHHSKVHDGRQAGTNLQNNIVVNHDPGTCASTLAAKQKCLKQLPLHREVVTSTSRSHCPIRQAKTDVVSFSRSSLLGYDCKLNSKGNFIPAEVAQSVPG